MRTLIVATPINHLKEHAILGIQFHIVDVVTPIAYSTSVVPVVTCGSNKILVPILRVPDVGMIIRVD